MLNNKIIFVYALLCVSALSAKFAIKNPTFTLEYSTVVYNPAVLRHYDHLVTVTKNNTTINVTSTDESFKPCHIDINPEGDHVNSRIQARGLGNGKIIVWGYDVQGRETNKTVNYVIFIVDPQNCTAKRVAKVQDNVPNTWSGYEGYVVPYQDTFDIFFKTYRTCSPCRFNEKGEKINVDHKLTLESPDDRSFFIDTMKENDASEGYHYSYQFQNYTGRMNEIEIQMMRHVAPDVSELDRFLHKNAISEPIKFQQISDKTYPFEMYGVRVKEEYCLVTSEKKEFGDDYNKPEVKLTVKCKIAPKDYINV